MGPVEHPRSMNESHSVVNKGLSCLAWRSHLGCGEVVQPDAQTEPRVLDQARRPRVAKPADERRREILDAATRLFRARGFDGTTVQAIADESNVAAGTIYLHFTSKDAILVALQEDYEAGLLDRVATVAADLLAEEDASGVLVTYEQVVDRLIDGMVAYTLARRELSQVLARHIGRACVVPDGPILAGGLTDVIARLIREGVRRGYVSSSDPAMTAYLLNLAATTAMSYAVAFEDDAMLERVVRQTKELYIKALVPAKPQLKAAFREADQAEESAERSDNGGYEAERGSV